MNQQVKVIKAFDTPKEAYDLEQQLNNKNKKKNVSYSSCNTLSGKYQTIKLTMEVK